MSLFWWMTRSVGPFKGSMLRRYLPMDVCKPHGVYDIQRRLHRSTRIRLLHWREHWKKLYSYCTLLYQTLVFPVSCLSRRNVWSSWPEERCRRKAKPKFRRAWFSITPVDNSPTMQPVGYMRIPSDIKLISCPTDNVFEGLLPTPKVRRLGERKQEAGQMTIVHPLWLSLSNPVNERSQQKSCF